MRSLQQEFDTLAIGTPQSFRNLTLFPLTRTGASECPPYMLADEAMQQGLARVTEVPGGSVPELRFENHCEVPVLLLDGEELVGAKQNRVVNLTILVPAMTTIVIPVSCVEAGRWCMDSDAFRPAAHMMYTGVRASRVRQVTSSMRISGTRRSDQAEIWNDIAAKARRMETASPTQAMSAIFERHSGSVEEYVRAFACSPAQAGIVFAGGNTVGMDLFDRPETMTRMFPKLLRSYALDAIECDAAEAPATADGAKRLLTELAGAPAMAEPAVGLGKDLRFTGPSAAGAALWAEDRFVHVCGFSGTTRATDGISTRLSRPSRRWAHRSGE